MYLCIIDSILGSEVVDLWHDIHLCQGSKVTQRFPKQHTLQFCTYKASSVDACCYLSQFRHMQGSRVRQQMLLDPLQKQLLFDGLYVKTKLEKGHMLLSIAGGVECTWVIQPEHLRKVAPSHPKSAKTVFGIVQVL